MDAKGLARGPLLAAAAILALIGFGPQAVAQGVGSPDGYVVDRGGEPLTDRGGECVKTRGWAPSDAIARCDPEYLPRAEAAQLEPEPGTEMQRVTIQAETLFDFDEYQLSDQGQRVLDQLANAMQQVEEPRVHIAGHTDFIGPEEYNQRLSEQRAEAVRDYLVSQGVPEQAVVTEARGESDPVVSCEGLAGDELIACLQPNRRTEIDFAGFQEVPLDDQSGAGQNVQ